MEQQTIADDLAAEVAGACLGMRVARLHRVVARLYEQALQTAGLTQPQMEVLTTLISAAGPVRPTALAARLMLERSTIGRNLALMQKKAGSPWSGPRPQTSDVRDDYRRRQIRQRTMRVARGV